MYGMCFCTREALMEICPSVNVHATNCSANYLHIIILCFSRNLEGIERGKEINIK